MEREIQRKSLDRFFRQEYRKLVNYVKGNLDERFLEASPEDIVQDVALGLMDKLELNTQIENLTAYIYKSIKNRIIDYRKKKQRAVSLESFTNSRNENYLLDTMKDETMEEELEYQDIDHETLMNAIAQLRPDEQAVILATVFEQIPYDELSEEWDIPVGTLLSRKHRALSKLHKILLNVKSQNQQ